MVRAFNQVLAELFRLHHRELVRFATRLVGNRDSGEEIAQETYLRLAGRAANVAAITHPKAYLFTAARNAAIDFTARRRTDWSYRVDVDDISVIASGDNPLDALHQRQRLARLCVALNELPAACRTTFVLNRIEGLDHREIARKAGNFSEHGRKALDSTELSPDQEAAVIAGANAAFTRVRALVEEIM